MTSPRAVEQFLELSPNPEFGATHFRTRDEPERIFVVRPPVHEHEAANEVGLVGVVMNESLSKIMMSHRNLDVIEIPISNFFY